MLKSKILFTLSARRARSRLRAFSLYNDTPSRPLIRPQHHLMRQRGSCKTHARTHTLNIGSLRVGPSSTLRPPHSRRMFYMFHTPARISISIHIPCWEEESRTAPHIFCARLPGLLIVVKHDKHGAGLPLPACVCCVQLCV